MLRGMGDALNPDCEFHRFNQDHPLPSDRHKARLRCPIRALSCVVKGCDRMFLLGCACVSRRASKAYSEAPQHLAPGVSWHGVVSVPRRGERPNVNQTRSPASIPRLRGWPRLARMPTLTRTLPLAPTQGSGAWAKPQRVPGGPAASRAVPTMPGRGAAAGAGGSSEDDDDGEALLLPKWSYVTALINRFGDAHGFDSLQKARHGTRA